VASKSQALSSSLLHFVDHFCRLGALSKLVMRQNNIHGAEAGKAFAGILAQNTVLKELDLSSQEYGYGGKALDAAFAKEFAVGISDNGAMTRLDISDSMLCGLYSDGSGTYNDAGVAALSDMLKGNSVLKELNMSKTYIGPEGAKVLSLGLSGNGALLSLSLSSNDLKAEGAEAIMKSIQVSNDV
jgi:hypothetical protein